MVINNGLNKIELTEGGDAKVSRASADYVRPTWDSIGSRVIGRHLFDMTNGWEGAPPRASTWSCTRRRSTST
jgi:hypothetical protein